MRSTASMLMPARVVATLTEEQTRSVLASASGMDSMRAVSPRVKPLWTSAEKPPTKSMPTSAAAASSACGDRDVGLGVVAADDVGDRRDRDALVDDGDAVLLLQLARRRSTRRPARRTILS